MLRAAATVALVAPSGEVLLIRRAAASRFFPGALVFPGGVVESGDYGDTLPDIVDVWRDHLQQPASPDSRSDRLALFSAYARAACRECREEVGLTLLPTELRPWARWITPEGEPGRTGRRYDTLFFVAPLPAGNIVLSAEHDAHIYVRPHEALDHFLRSEIILAPPTAVTLAELAACVDPLLTLRLPLSEWQPVVVELEGRPALILPGDVLHPRATQVAWPAPVTTRILLGDWPRWRFWH